MRGVPMQGEQCKGRCPIDDVTAMGPFPQHGSLGNFWREFQSFSHTHTHTPSQAVLSLTRHHSCSCPG